MFIFSNTIVHQEVISEFEKLDFDVFTQPFSLQAQVRNISALNALKLKILLFPFRNALDFSTCGVYLQIIVLIC